MIIQSKFPTCLTASVDIICAPFSLALIHFFTWEKCKSLITLSLGHLLDGSLQCGNLRDEIISPIKIKSGLAYYFKYTRFYKLSILLLQHLGPLEPLRDGDKGSQFTHADAHATGHTMSQLWPLSLMSVSQLLCQHP